MSTNDTRPTTALELTPARRSELRAAAHGLNPVVSISQKGLSPSVLDEIERCLKAHELIKIRVFETDRDARDALLAEICTTLAAAPRPRRNPPRLTKKAAAAKTDKAARARPLEKGKPRRPTRTR